MLKYPVAEGDRLISISYPGEDLGKTTYKVGTHVYGISVVRLPGPMGEYLAANVVFEDDRPDIIAPLHMLRNFEVLNP
jgi:hypothetical protein